MRNAIAAIILGKATLVHPNGNSYATSSSINNIYHANALGGVPIGLAVSQADYLTNTTTYGTNTYVPNP